MNERYLLIFLFVMSVLTVIIAVFGGFIFETENYSPEFRAEISKDFDNLKNLAERIKAKVKE